jgi:hypothetical protein
MVPVPEPSFSEAQGTKATLMINRATTRRGDEQLAAILYETASWTVKGRHGAVIGEVASLRCADEQAVEIGGIGPRIVAFVRSSPSEIVVFAAQIQRLAIEGVGPLGWPVALYAINA